MELQGIPKNNLRNQILQVIGRHMNLNGTKVFFFGSRVKGTNMPRSGIDVGVLGPQPLSSRTKLDILDELENLPTLYKIDFVDFSRVSESFRKETMQNIEMLN